MQTQVCLEGNSLWPVLRVLSLSSRFVRATGAIKMPSLLLGADSELDVDVVRVLDGR